jgi:hypothetical protein
MHVILSRQESISQNDFGKRFEMQNAKWELLGIWRMAGTRLVATL